MDKKIYSNIFIKKYLYEIDLIFSSDLDAIKERALWLDESQKYKLPELVILRTKLPPAGKFSFQRYMYFFQILC